jgi:hypothetical protein
MKERRRAVEAKLIEKSNSNPGYYKYQIKIRELDGREHVVPSYGVDMQDAIKRLIKKESKVKTLKVYRKVSPIGIILMMVTWVASILTSIITKNELYAYYTVMTFLSVAIIYAVYSFFKKP